MTKLKEKIIDQIKLSKAISFHDFMNIALYDKDLGYYFTSKEKIGRGGDFYTSSNVGDSFGALIAKDSLEKHLKINSHNENLTIIEIGAGTGQLAFDILYSLKNELNFPLEKVKYFIREISPTLQITQKETLAPFLPQVEWISIEDVKNDSLNAIVIANEVLDSFPIHQFRWNKKQLEELYITAKDSNLIPFWQSIDLENLPTDIGLYLENLKIEIIDKQTIEINLAATQWIKEIARVLKKGFVIIIDYGDLSDHLYSLGQMEGTLRCFFKHTLNNNYLENIGEQDITADVNFEILMTYAKLNGFEITSFTRQADYLIKLGLLDRLQKAIEIDPTSFQSLKTRLAMKNFFIPGGISDHFRVLVLKKT
jgi:SAM-dependent MidA family methyltransferase